MYFYRSINSNDFSTLSFRKKTVVKILTFFIKNKIRTRVYAWKCQLFSYEVTIYCVGEIEKKNKTRMHASINNLVSK